MSLRTLHFALDQQLEVGGWAQSMFLFGCVRVCAVGLFRMCAASCTLHGLQSARHLPMALLCVLASLFHPSCLPSCAHLICLAAYTTGLINATFGNVVEIMLSIAALTKGLYDVVAYSLIGSILSNLLLVLGMITDACQMN